MKKSYAALSFVACSLLAFKSFSIDLSPSNFSSNVYFDSYDDNNKIIKGINFDVLTDGTSTLNKTAPFKIKLGLYDAATKTTVYIKTIDVSKGQSEMSSATYSDIDIDISAVSDLTTKSYRLALFVDADNQITETNENNNNVLFGGTVDYTATGIKKPDLIVDEVVYSYTNKVLSFDHIKIKNAGTANAAASKVKISVFDADGNNSESIFSINSIAAGSSLTVNPDDMDLNFVPDGIKLSLKVIADADAQVSEDNETNNEKLVTDDISKQPLGISPSLSAENLKLVINSAAVNLSMPSSEEVNISIFDTRGNLVTTLANNNLSAGNHSFTHGLAQRQAYICRISGKQGSFSRKFVLE